MQSSRERWIFPRIKYLRGWKIFGILLENYFHKVLRGKSSCEQHTILIEMNKNLFSTFWQELVDYRLRILKRCVVDAKRWATKIWWCVGEREREKETNQKNQVKFISGFFTSLSNIRLLAYLDGCRQFLFIFNFFKASSFDLFRFCCTFFVIFHFLSWCFFL